LNALGRLSDDLVRRHGVSARLEGAELIVPMDGVEIRISKDDAIEDRIVVWSELARPAQHEMLQAARISLRYNDECAYARSVTLGVSTAAKCALLGRSVAAVGLDSERILTEVRDFCGHLRDAKIYFAEASAAARDEEIKASALNEANINYLHMR